MKTGLSVRCGAIALLFCAVASAQVTTATIFGTVLDSSGAALPGAAVKIENLGTGASSSVVSGSQGEFTATFLPVGRYDITI